MSKTNRKTQTPKQTAESLERVEQNELSYILHYAKQVEAKRVEAKRKANQELFAEACRRSQFAPGQNPGEITIGIH